MCDEVYKVVTIYELNRNQGKKGVGALEETKRVLGLSSKQVRLYVRYSYLIVEILDAVEQRIIKKSVAYELSFFSDNEQQEWYRRLVKGEHITARMLKNDRLIV